MCVVRQRGIATLGGWMDLGSPRAPALLLWVSVSDWVHASRSPSSLPLVLSGTSTKSPRRGP